MGLVAPMVAVAPFVFALEEDEEDPSKEGLLCRRCGWVVLWVRSIDFMFICVFRSIH